MTAALAAVVVIALGAEFMTRDIPAVAAISEPIAAPTPQWSRIERLEAQPMGVTPGLANSDVASTDVAGLRNTIPAVVLERAEVVATADPPQGRGPDRTSSAVVRTPAAREPVVTPAVANSVAAATEVAGQRDTIPAAVREQAEVVAAADAPEERGLDRPDASAFADRAEVPLLSDRAQGTRTTADPSKSHPLAMPAVFRATESVFAVRADAAVTARLDVSAVSDRSVPVPDRPETSTLLGAVLDRPDQPERPDKPEHPEKPERPETIEKPDKPERPEVAERPDKVDRPEKPERPEQIERPDKPERPELVARPDMPERPDKPERPEQIERPDLPERPELVARPDIPERPDKPDKPEKPDKPDRPERPERPG